MKDKLIDFFKRHKMIFLSLVILIPLYSALLIKIDLLIRNLINDFFTDSPSTFFRPMLFFLVVSVFTIVVKFIIDIGSSFSENKLSIFLRKEVYSKIIYDGQDVVAKDQLIEIWTNDIPKISNSIVEVIKNYYLKIVLGLIAAVQLYIVEPNFLLVIILLVIACMFPLKSIGNFVGKAASNYRKKNIQFSSIILNSFEGFEVVKTYDLFDWLVERLRKLSDRQASLLAVYIQKNNLTRILKRIINSLLPAAVLLLSYVYLSRLRITIGDVILSLFLVTKINDGVSSVTEINSQYKSIEQRLVSLNDFFNKKTTRNTSYNYEKKISKIMSLELKDISLQVNNKTILDGVSLMIKPGDKIAIMGNSGAGKTTLFKTIIGLVKPSKGQIKVNNILLEDMDQKSFWDRISYAPSNVLLREDKLINNISKNHNNKNRNMVIDRIKIENRNRIIDKTGSNISGGERKKVLFAREFSNMSTTDIFVLDEITTGVDSHATKEMMKFLKQTDEIVIMITHDLNVAKQMDKIYYLEKGKLI